MLCSYVEAITTTLFCVLPGIMISNNRFACIPNQPLALALHGSLGTGSWAFCLPNADHEQLAAVVSSRPFRDLNFPKISWSARWEQGTSNGLARLVTSPLVFFLWSKRHGWQRSICYPSTNHSDSNGFRLRSTWMHAVASAATRESIVHDGVLRG
jgi:hypothetical protein